MYTYCSIYRDPKKTFPSIQDFWALPTDNNRRSQLKDEEDAKRLHEKLKKFKREIKK